MNLTVESTLTDPITPYARTGQVSTVHGPFSIPNFMPVATRGSLRGIFAHELKDLGCEILLSNAFHLYLRPGNEHIRDVHQGLHRFMGWEGPILTDSGGYQVFSLANLRKIDPEHGIKFLSPYDGSHHLYTPEIVVKIQSNLGSTFMMQLDELHPYDAPTELLHRAIQTTLTWYKRSLKALETYPSQGTLVPILQGGCHPELRKWHLDQLLEMDPPSVIAIGGLSVGEPRALFQETLAALMEQMPKDRLVYLMGVGAPEDLLFAISQGVDLFDCVLPTRNGRNGQVFTFEGRFNLKNARFRDDPNPLSQSCKCPICRHYSRSHLHHLIRTHEMNAPIGISIHNLFFFFHFFSRIRETIQDGSFSHFKRTILDCYKSEAAEHP